MKNFSDLTSLIRQLRDKDKGCPWDKKQTHHSLKPYLLEESHELLEALDSEVDSAILDELGDVLLQIMLHSQIASEADRFGIDDVVNHLSRKLINRHPHVFEDGFEKLTNADDVDAIWQQRKHAEGRQQAGWLKSFPSTLPSLTKAVKIQKSANKLGFDWEDIAPVFDKIQEELDEVKQALTDSTQAHIEEEIGDVLFSVVNLSRHLRVDPEFALTAANKKFIQRFDRVNDLADSSDSDLKNMPIADMELLWEQAKRTE